MQPKKYRIGTKAIEEKKAGKGVHPHDKLLSGTELIRGKELNRKRELECEHVRPERDNIGGSSQARTLRRGTRREVYVLSACKKLISFRQAPSERGEICSGN